MHPEEKSVPYFFFYFVYSITGVYTIYGMQFALAKTVRLTEVLKEKSKLTTKTIYHLQYAICSS